MSIEEPKGYTWDMCYVINEVCQEKKYPVEDYEFDVFEQSSFSTEEENNIVYLEDEEPCWC